MSAGNISTIAQMNSQQIKAMDDRLERLEKAVDRSTRALYIIAGVASGQFIGVRELVQHLFS